jgi:hypothetical protein
VNPFLLLAIFIIIFAILFIWDDQRKKQFDGLLREFAEQHSLTISDSEGPVRVLGMFGGRSITIERFDAYGPGSRLPERAVRILLSTNAPGHIYLKLKGRTFLFNAWDPQQEPDPGLDLLFESECHPSDFLDRLAEVDSLLAYKLGSIFKQIGKSGVVLELKAGQISLQHQRALITVEQMETAVNALERLAAAAERAASEPLSPDVSA